MTLVELIVVLAILVALAGTALLATEGLVEQGRRDACVRSLEAFREALLGRADLVDVNGKPWVRGFVADLGRLPQVSGVPGADPLEELWTPPADADAHFAIEAPPGDLQVQLAVGWRGPYLQLPLGRSRWLDGWGAPPQVLRADGTPALAGDPIAQIASLGADGLPGGEGYDTDLAVAIESSVAPLQPALQHGDVPVRATGLAADAQVVIRVYGSVDGRAGTIAEAGPLLASAGEVAALFSDVPVGPRVLRAYVLAGAAPASPDDPVDAAMTGPLVPLTVVAGGLHEVVIDMDGSGS
jgi:type II secretory pathway pseudopilin PulG